jgi:lysophospholipase L1-like esterase
VYRAVAGLVLTALLGAGEARGVTVATVGDSLADAIYLGLKLQPDLLRKNGIKLVRWSRPKIGLTRIDYFDYNAWLRDTESLGHADFCVVEMGANDLQSIGVGPQKWIRLGTEDWKRAYADRVLGLVNTLKSRRCGKVVWLLQPPYQKNKFLNQYHDLINSAQLTGAATSAAAFDIAAGENDYSADGIHPNKDFCFKLGRAVANLLASWQQPFAGSNCADCHASGGPSGRLVPSQLRDVAPLVLKRAD